MEGASVYEVQRAMEELAEATGRAAKTARRAAEEAEEAEEEEAEAEEGRGRAELLSRRLAELLGKRLLLRAFHAREGSSRVRGRAFDHGGRRRRARGRGTRGGGVDGSRGDGVRRIGAVGRRVSRGATEGAGD